MKKLICLLFVLVFTLIFATMGFAASEEDITDPTAPGSADAVTEDMYDEETPQSSELVDTDVPAAGELVQTGGIPAELFYAGGGLCIVGALFVSRKKTKSSTK